MRHHTHPARAGAAIIVGAVASAAAAGAGVSAPLPRVEPVTVAQTSSWRVPGRDRADVSLGDRLHAYSSDGPVLVTLNAGQVKHRRSPLEQMPAATDRSTERVLASSLAVPITGTLRVSAGFALSHMTRRLAVLPVTGRRKSTDGAVVGIGLEGSDGASVGLDYLRIGPSGRRDPIERMAELIGGAPAAERGLRLSLTSRTLHAPLGDARLGLSFAAMRRSLRDSALSQVSGQIVDRHALLSLDLRF